MCEALGWFPALHKLMAVAHAWNAVPWKVDTVGQTFKVKHHKFEPSLNSCIQPCLQKKGFLFSCLFFLTSLCLISHHNSGISGTVETQKSLTGTKPHLQFRVSLPLDFMSLHAGIDTLLHAQVTIPSEFLSSVPSHSGTPPSLPFFTHPCYLSPHTFPDLS